MVLLSGMSIRCLLLSLIQKIIFILSFFSLLPPFLWHWFCQTQGPSAQSFCHFQMSKFPTSTQCILPQTQVRQHWPGPLLVTATSSRLCPISGTQWQLLGSFCSYMSRNCPLPAWTWQHLLFASLIALSEVPLPSSLTSTARLILPLSIFYSKISGSHLGKPME